MPLHEFEDVDVVDADALTRKHVDSTSHPTNVFTAESGFAAAGLAPTQSHSGVGAESTTRANDPAKSVLRRDHPCYRDGLDERLVVRSRVVTTATGQRAPLLNEDGSVKMRADHYRCICTQEPWRVPLLFGMSLKLPKFKTTTLGRLRGITRYMRWSCSDRGGLHRKRCRNGSVCLRGFKAETVMLCGKRCTRVSWHGAMSWWNVRRRIFRETPIYGNLHPRMIVKTGGLA